ncbi:MAG TPA: hypothetical protein VFJ18_08590, partial [Pararhizobium sp.]|nr:hypothetical protein [Pararhizobium sp.]
FIVAVPLGIGLISFIALMLVEYHKQEALAPIKKMWTTLPVVGTIVAMVGGGAFVTFVLLTIQFLLEVEKVPPLWAGLSFWPQVVGVVITAAMLGILFRTRYLPVLAFAGMLVIIIGGILLAVIMPSGNRVLLLSAVALLGLGAGATVSPGLFLAGLSLPSRILGRIFALIELVRSVADFIMAPVMEKIATATSASPPLSSGGVHEAIILTLIIMAATLVLCLAIYLLGGARLPKPDIEAWIEKDGIAVDSPDLLHVLRDRS